MRGLGSPISEMLRAPTPAQARRVAAAMEGGQIADPTPVGNETLAFRSGFQDEKLYQVRQVHLTGTSDDGPAEVLSARTARPASRPWSSGDLTSAPLACDAVRVPGGDAQAAATATAAGRRLPSH